ncbi:MAG: dienelactone hydrolase family protein [Hyphomicrobiaceae bacterium]|nr:dienelactone hydrolase family protein [Hyphomicrobiaceae bacterium]
MGTTVDIPTTDGHKLTGYRAEPEGEPRGGIVVIQEIFGVNSHIRSVADGFAAEGYVALAPGMFDRVGPDIQLGYTPEDVTEGREIRAKIDYDDAVRDMGAAVAALSGLPVGVVGYCWGGSLAWSAATRLDGLRAAVGYYGGFVPEMSDESPRHPVMLHFGETDESIPLEGVDKVKAAHPDVPVYLYSAGHGFNCDQRGSYDEASATLARERTLAFFAEHVAKS